MKKNRLFMTGMAALLLSFGLILAGCGDSGDPTSPGDDNTAKDKVVNALTLGGLVTAPVRGAQPDTRAIDTA
jgi:hypothetical protein